MPLRCLVVEADDATREMIVRELAALPSARADSPPLLESVASGTEALATIDDDVDVVVASLEGPAPAGIELLAEARRRGVGAEFLLTAPFGTVEDAVAAIRAGAADFLSQPFTGDELRLAVERATEQHDLKRQNRSLREALDDRLRPSNIVTNDARVLAIFKTAKSVAATRTTVLITGESGTGKTLLARALHGASDRADGPFVEVNCGALPESLLESELFGHVRGAFTGAVKDKPGKFEAADGGTIFLDEIGTSSPAFQVKLLRVLQDRVIERVGDTETRPVDVRVVLATNLDLARAVQDGTFREDLYYRIHVVSLEMPPLRARSSDVPLLAKHFLRRFATELDKPIRGFTDAALAKLVAAPWPGNVRQLENVVERAVVLAEHDVLDLADLPIDLGVPALAPAETATIAPESMIAEHAHLQPLKVALEGPERLLIERALAHHGGNRQQTAASLGINRSTLFNKMRKYGLLRSTDRSPDDVRV